MTRHQPLAAIPPLPASDPRVDAILMLARRAFVEKGFDGASMQDLARAAGMSAGNFYRYFNSKSAIVEALVTRDLDEIEQQFAAVVGSPDPIAALRSVLRRRLIEDCGEDFSLWAEITATAARKPEIAAACGRMETDIVAKIVHVLSVGCDIPPASGAARFTTTARFILLLVRGAAIQGSISGRQDPALNDLILSSINSLIDEVTIPPAKA